MLLKGKTSLMPVFYGYLAGQGQLFCHFPEFRLEHITLRAVRSTDLPL
jgi:predicted ATPase